MREKQLIIPTAIHTWFIVPTELHAAPIRQFASTNRDRDEMEVYNLSTQHRMAVSRPHVKALVPDTVRDTPGGPKHGIFELAVQLIFENGQMRFEPHPTLRDRINEPGMELSTRITS